VRNDTPIEKVTSSIFVKREDLATLPPGPPFSKTRGLFQHLFLLSRLGIKCVGYVETAISMAGWAVAWLGKKMNMKVIIFDPQYKDDSKFPLSLHRQKWKQFGAQLVKVKAGRASVNWYIARRWMKENVHQPWKLLPLGLPLNETVLETFAQARKCIKDFPTIVVPIGSGTIACGIARALYRNQRLIGVMSRTGDVRRKFKFVIKWCEYPTHVDIVDPGYPYTKKVDIKTPFPCNPYYDTKAWQWLLEHEDELEKPILFWNIGA